MEVARKMIRYFWILFVFLLLFLFPSHSFADSSYVLPYPSSMPGSKFYSFHLIEEKIMSFWYFGNFSKFKYSLKQSDKYLIEAKTLFNYKQYLLAYKALVKSDYYFEQVLPYLYKAQKEGKDIGENKFTFEEAKQKHIEVLDKLLIDLPKEFVWTDEKVAPIKLNLLNKIEQSVLVRKKQ